MPFRRPLLKPIPGHPDTSERNILAQIFKLRTESTSYTVPGSEAGTLAILMPFSSGNSLIRLPVYTSKKGTYKIGSDPNPGTNDLVINRRKIAGKHCTFSWEYKEGFAAMVELTGHSYGEVTVNDHPVGYDAVRYIEDGDVICFAPNVVAGEDNRYIFKYTYSMPQARRATMWA